MLSVINNINERIRYVRESLHINRKGFAKSIYISVSYLGELESGTKKPSDLCLFAISQRYAANMKWLQTGEGAPFSLAVAEDRSPYPISTLPEKIDRLGVIEQKGTIDERAQIFGLIDSIYSDIIRREMEEAESKRTEGTSFQGEEERKQRPA